jgi:hypothetical protein
MQMKLFQGIGSLRELSKIEAEVNRWLSSVGSIEVRHINTALAAFPPRSEAFDAQMLTHIVITVWWEPRENRTTN